MVIIKELRDLKDLSHGVSVVEARYVKFDVVAGGSGRWWWKGWRQRRRGGRRLLVLELKEL